MDAMWYYRTNDWCKGKAILLMNHNMGNWIEDFDWDMLKSDALIVSFSSTEYQHAFEKLIGKSRTWVLANSTMIPKYHSGGTPNKSQRIQTWTRRGF